MGGTNFGKTFGKVTTTIIDPFGIGKSQFGKTVRKVIDPLNIMDPFNILPGQGEKWGTFDKNYGGPLQDLLGLRSKQYYSPTPYNPSTLDAAYQKQNALTSQMMGDLLMDKQTLANANQTLFSQDLASKNAAQQQNITAGLQAANLGMQTTAPTTTPATLALQPATQNKTTTLNQFTMPSISGLTFGGT